MRPKSLFTLGGAAFVGGTLSVFAARAVDAAVLVPVTAIATVVGGGVASRVSPESVEQFQESPWLVGGVFGVPAVLGLATLGFGIQGATMDIWERLAGLGLCFGGALGMVHAAQREHACRLVAESEVSVHLPGRFSYYHHRLGRWRYVGFGAAGLGYAWLLWYLFSISGLELGLLYLLMSLTAFHTVYRFLTDSEMVVVEPGLLNGVSVTPWDRYEAYELTEEYLVLHYDGSTRTELQLPRAGIDDERTVTHALSQHLPAKR